MKIVRERLICSSKSNVKIGQPKITTFALKKKKYFKNIFIFVKR